MTDILTLRAQGWSVDGPVFASGPVIAYRVDGMPQSQEARIMTTCPNRSDWQIRRIKDRVSSGWAGHYPSAEKALAVLQKEFE